MTTPTLLLACTISILPLTSLTHKTADVFPDAATETINSKSTALNFMQEPGNEKMTAVVFRLQNFCRAELKDFEFDAIFTVYSATVYFSGANFKNIEKGSISSNSLKPIRHLMDRCVPGSIVIFDNVKVIGPDKTIRPIAGLSLMLH